MLSKQSDPRRAYGLSLDNIKRVEPDAALVECIQTTRSLKGNHIDDGRGSGKGPGRRPAADTLEQPPRVIGAPARADHKLKG